MKSTIIFAMWLLALLIDALFQEWQEHEAEPDRFPPITDEEFLALCRPGTNRRIALGVRRIVAEQLGVTYERIHPDMRFVEDLGCD